MSVVPSLRGNPVYDRPGGAGRGAGEPVRVSEYSEPIAETIRHLFASTLPPDDRAALVGVYGVGETAPDYARPLKPNDVMAVRAKGRGTIELSAGDTEAKTDTPYLTTGTSTVYVDVFGTPAIADRLRREVEIVLTRIRINSSHAIPQWTGDASAITRIDMHAPNWHHIAEDAAAGTDEQWAGEIICHWQIRAP